MARRAGRINYGNGVGLVNVLIADDNPQRYKCLESMLSVDIRNRIKFDYSISANEVREKLEENVYDLLVLDILLPKTQTDSPDSYSYSMDILNELNSSDFMNRPKYILGITGDVDAYSDNQEFFKSYTWSILHYDQMSDEWAHNLVNCINYLLGCEKHGETFVDKHDFTIICALESPELKPFLNFDWNWSSQKPMDDQTFYYSGWFDDSGIKRTVSLVAADRMGMVESALLTSRVIESLEPRCVVMSGICGGVSGKVSLCDILLADPSWDYQCGKWVVDDAGHRSFLIEPHQVAVDPVVRTAAKQALTADSIFFIAKQYPGADGLPIPNFNIAPVASGSAVLADGGAIKDILLQNRKLSGIDMEIYGVFYACIKSKNRPRFFAIKSVSDLADVDKDDKHQYYCSYLSASSVKLMIETQAGRLLK